MKKKESDYPKLELQIVEIENNIEADPAPESEPEGLFIYTIILPD